jgi:hypothetical protein
MRKSIPVIILLLLQLLSAKGQQNISTSNEGAIDKSLIAGHFDIDKKNEQRGITEHINVNYSLSPAPFTKYLTLELSTAQPTLFTADIVDAKGQKVKHWAPQAKSYFYKDVINISSLAPGNYKVNLYSEISTTLIYSIAFHKEKTN